MVQIDMDCFVRQFQPSKLDAWLKDEDVAPHPEDDQKKLMSRSASQLVTDDFCFKHILSGRKLFPEVIF